MHTGVYGCVTDAYGCIRVHTDAYGCIRMHTGVQDAATGPIFIDFHRFSSISGAFQGQMGLGVGAACGGGWRPVAAKSYPFKMVQ